MTSKYANPLLSQQQHYYDKLKAKLSKAPFDSGIAIVEDASAIDYAVTPVRVDTDRLQGTAPRAAHGATPNPVVVSVESEFVVAETMQLVGMKRLLFFLPALFDLGGTTIMNVGLLYTPVSIYQMVRGSLSLWVGLFSVLYLGRRLSKQEIGALVVVSLGVAIVGLSGAKHSDLEAAEGAVSKVLLGVALILFAQLFTASQFVVEEKVTSFLPTSQPLFKANQRRSWPITASSPFEQSVWRDALDSLLRF